MAIVVERLEKIYKEKGGADVRALKGISFKLPDTGMVFILGKSGCGKSTLLNILGGIDGFDGGDILIDGKSLKDYKDKDLDVYRNLYTGFVFQENNLLENESVKRNVSLALELQGKKDGGGKVTAALESVGLEELAERKCNCLSGGQKQRVVLARALIKQPKLLLCDEPTGALDSETGEGIFDLIKEISRDRLVLVVSHDRESAEKYGDRIIELKDGEIIFDNAPLAVVAATAEKREKKRGGLRFFRAFTMGAGYIITKPIRMIICFLLCLITFSLVGVADSVNAYNRDSAMLYSMESIGSKCYTIGRVSKFEDSYYLSRSDALSPAQADEIASLLTAKRADRVYRLADLGMANHVAEVVRQNGKDRDNHPEDQALIYGYVETDEAFCGDYGFRLAAGRLPQNYGEVAIPLYIYEFFKTFGYGKFNKEDYDFGTGSSIFEYNDRCEINSFDDLLGKTVSFTQIMDGDNTRAEFTVTGIVDSGSVTAKIRNVLFGGAERYDYFDQHLRYQENEYIYNSVFVCRGFAEYFTENVIQSGENNIMCVIAPFAGSKAEKLENIRVYQTRCDGEPVGLNSEKCYHLINFAVQLTVDAEHFMYSVTQYSVYVAIAVVAITVLLLTYYASGTIAEKRREIGILRAMGASRRDIIKIFACEHGLFTVITVILSAAVGAILTAVLNASFLSGLAAGAVLVKFGIRQLAVVAAVAIFAVALGVAVPLIRLLIKKPVDIIADRK